MIEYVNRVIDWLAEAIDVMVWRANNLMRWIRRIPIRVKDMITLGFDRSELWNLNYTLARYTLPRLREFRKRSIGHPCLLTQEAWYAILDAMILAFDLIERDHSSDDLTDAQWDDVRKGLNLFAEHFTSLWD